MLSGENSPAGHHATFRGGVVILLGGEPRLIRPPRQEYLLAGAFVRQRHHVCDRTLALGIGEAEAAREPAPGNFPIWKVEFGSIHLLSRCCVVILLYVDILSRPASGYR